MYYTADKLRLRPRLTSLSKHVNLILMVLIHIQWR